MSAYRAELKRKDNVDRGIAGLTYLCLMSKNLKMDSCLSILLSEFINTFNQYKCAAATVPNEMTPIKISSLLYGDTEKMPHNNRQPMKSKF